MGQWDIARQPPSSPLLWQPWLSGLSSLFKVSRSLEETRASSSGLAGHICFLDSISQPIQRKRWSAEHSRGQVVMPKLLRGADGTAFYAIYDLSCTYSHRIILFLGDLAMHDTNKPFCDSTRRTATVIVKHELSIDIDWTLHQSESESFTSIGSSLPP